MTHPLLTWKNQIEKARKAIEDEHLNLQRDRSRSASIGLRLADEYTALERQGYGSFSARNRSISTIARLT